MSLLQASVLAAFLVATGNAHSILISPRPRNAIDTLDKRWGANGSSPDVWQHQFGNVHGAACACRNGTEAACLSGQTCLWMSVGCTIGCKECDGGVVGNKSTGTNPNGLDRCGSGKKATNNNPLHRTFNRNCTGSCIGSKDDFTKFNPWRAPGSAPVYDPCGRAGGGPRPTAGKGEYVTTAYAKLGNMGSQLPTMPSGAVWQAGAVVETMWSVRANHGGGWQFRLCPLGSALTEECFQQTFVFPSFRVALFRRVSFRFFLSFFCFVLLFSSQSFVVAAGFPSCLAARFPQMGAQVTLTLPAYDSAPIRPALCPLPFAHPQAHPVCGKLKDDDSQRRDARSQFDVRVRRHAADGVHVADEPYSYDA